MYGPSYSQPRGFRDHVGDTVRRHRHIEATVVAVLERAGYDEIAVPTLEYADLYHPDRLGPLYHELIMGRLTEPAIFPAAAAPDPEDALAAGASRATTDVALRPEFTAPVARHVAARVLAGEPPACLPLRLAYAGQVFRNVHPGPERTREFRQVGAELIGSAAPLADLEVMGLAADAATALGVPDWSLHIGHAALFRELLVGLGLLEPALSAVARDLGVLDRVRRRLTASDEAVCAYACDFAPRLLDSLVQARKRAGATSAPPAALLAPERVSAAEWRAQLAPYYEEKMRLVWRHQHQIDDDLAAKALAVERLSGPPDEFFGRIAARPFGRAGAAVVEELRFLTARLAAPIHMKAVVNRGIDYYTGTTFELHTPATGSAYTDFCGGGRYDDLYQWVLARARATEQVRGRALPATATDADASDGALSSIGFAFGVERVAGALPAMVAPRGRVLVLWAAAESGDQAFALARELRARGLVCACALAATPDGDLLAARLAHAAQRGTDTAVLFRAPRGAPGAVVVRDLRAGVEESLPLADVAEHVARCAREREEERP
jgi:histidyl-tRNA synthetase